MTAFVAGLVTGCLLGVGGTFLLLLIAVTLYRERSTPWTKHSLWGPTYAAVILVTLAGVSHLLKLDKISSILLFLFGVLAISKQGGLFLGLVASAISAVVVSVWFMPPLGSLMVKGPDDRLDLTLFLLIAILGSRLVGGRKEIPA